MGAVSPVRVVALASVPRIDLPGGGWSRMVLTGASLDDANVASLGFSIFKPGTVTAPVAHETEEVAYVLGGSGELRLDDGTAPFSPGDGLFVPAGTWHAVANTSEEDVAMVFGFPHPDYPPTERRS